MFDSSALENPLNMNTFWKYGDFLVSHKIEDVLCILHFFFTSKL